MKQEDIIRMAQEAGGNIYEVDWCFEIENLQRFAALVERRVARECAELRDAIKYEGYVPPEDGGARDYYNSAAQDCADAIRAKFLRGEEGK